MPSHQSKADLFSVSHGEKGISPFVGSKKVTVNRAGITDISLSVKFTEGCDHIFNSGNVFFRGVSNNSCLFHKNILTTR